MSASVEREYPHMMFNNSLLDLHEHCSDSNGLTIVSYSAVLVPYVELRHSVVSAC